MSSATQELMECGQIDARDRHAGTGTSVVFATHRRDQLIPPPGFCPPERQLRRIDPSINSQARLFISWFESLPVQLNVIYRTR